jgi:DNA-binding NtrC family response regulator
MTCWPGSATRGDEQAIEVVMLSGHTGTSDANEALEAGAFTSSPSPSRLPSWSPRLARPWPPRRQGAGNADDYPQLPSDDVALVR